MKYEPLPEWRVPDYDPAPRIALLRSYLDPYSMEYKHPGQHKNIRAAIRAHEEGKLKGKPEVWFIDGEMYDEEPHGLLAWPWLKVCFPRVLEVEGISH